MYVMGNHDSLLSQDDLHAIFDLNHSPIQVRTPPQAVWLILLVVLRWSWVGTGRCRAASAAR